MSTGPNEITQQTTQIASSTTSSAWSRGPPSAANSKSSSAIQTPNSAGTPQPQAEGGKLESNESAPAPVAIGGHSRKGSLMVGGGADIGRGSLKFGTMDSESNLLSSSPAAPSVTGAHLSSDDVKTFGSIDANSNTDPNAVKAPRRTTNGPVNGGKPLDAHAFFGARPRLNGSPSPSGQPNQPGQPGQPSHDRRQSLTGFQAPNGMPPTAHPTHLRPPQPGAIPGQPRSPVLSPPVPGQYAPGPQMQQGFRPGQHMPNAAGFVRPNGPAPAMQPGMQRGIGGYPMHPGAQGPYPIMGYPQGYYDHLNMYGAPQYSIPQWAPQQHPQNQQQFNVPVSPRGNPAQVTASPSPVPPSVNLPSSGGASPVPTPPSRPSSHMGHHPSASNVSVSSIPSTPARPQLPPNSAFTPSASGQSPYGLSGSASSFTPRVSKAIKFTRPDGTAVDIKKEAAAAKGSNPPQPSASGTPEPKEEPKKNVPAMPVVVRMESESQRQERLKEEAQAAKIKEIEAKEEEERKERKARQAREQADKEAADKAAAEKEAAEKKQQEQAREQKEAADKAKADEERSAAKARQEAERAESEEKAAAETATKKAEEEKAATEAQDKTQKEKVQINDSAAAEGSVASSTPLASATVSPLSSPALAAAGLPPKPVAAAGLPRRPAPAALEVSTPPPESPTVASALSTARPIDDLSSVTYPGTLKSPQPKLNADAEPGKFRYDRDFLMQFMSVCKEKPDSLPPLEEIGLEAESSSGFGSRGGRGGRSSAGTGKGSSPAGLGIGGLNRPPFPQGMGSFRMGEFGSLRGSTSEDRYNRSLAQSRQGGMARTPSQGGVHGLPSMSLSTSRSGANRSRGGMKRAPQNTQLDPDMAPLQVSSTSWVRSRPTGDDEGTPAFIERKVKSLLNKLTAEKFDSISAQILEWANKSANETDGMTLKLVIKQIFEKATDEAHWSNMYARLCRMLLLRLDPAITEVVDGKPVSGGLLFRKYLVGRCQADFEAGWKAREEASSAALAKREEDKEKQEKNKEEGGETAMLSDEYYAEQKAKRRGLGLVQLIGELYKLDMIGKGVIRTCFARLLANVETPDEEDLESTCKLLTTVGEQYDRASPENMEIVFDRLNTILEGDKVISRIRFMIMDVFDLRRKGWVSKKAQTGVMTIAEVHQQAAREQAEKSAAAAQASRDSISRGGSRAGSRRDAAQPGEWQSVGAAAPGRPIPRPADFSQLGRGVSSAGSAGPNFGPKSVFNKAKGKASGSVTPPLSRQASTSNMFSALDEPSSSTERRESADASEPQRPKLQLKPRTKPLPGEDGGDDGSEDADENEEDEGQQDNETGEMSEDKAKTKIDADTKELWGEKDAGGSRNPEDVVEYLRALPPQYQPLLTVRLLEDVFRISKVKDAEVVAKGWSQALSEGVASKDVLLKGLEARMPSLDDDSIDFPQAYKAIAVIIRGISLEDQEIDALLEKVDVFGEPRITPKMKLDKALAQVDEEQ